MRRSPLKPMERPSAAGVTWPSRALSPHPLLSRSISKGRARQGAALCVWNNVEFEASMKDRRSRATISELARQAGAHPRSSWPLRIFRALLRQWTTRKRHASGLVMFAGEDAPRDLDDPLSDPKIQARVGEVIAKRAKRSR